jgi:hypothetical protein
MSLRPTAVAVLLMSAHAGLVCMYAGLAVAQEDKHAEAVTRASCQTGKHSEAVTSATAALARDPDELGPRLRLADALVDQGCYQEAVAVLEAGEENHPRSGELAGKLRDMRSLVTEQTYIEGLTQAAEGAKVQRNQLRCMRLGDLTACDDALKFKPDDPQLIAARSEALKAKLAAAETLQASTAAASKSTTPLASAQPEGAQPHTPDTRVATAQNNRTKAPKQRAAAPVEPPATSVASLEPPQSSRTYSNDAPAGQSN